jgi:hypothetical protein
MIADRPVGTPGPLPRRIADRLWAGVDKNGSVPDRGPERGRCWLWQGKPNKGYGQMGVGSRLDGTGTMKGTHVIAWELICGPVPEGLHVCHWCDTRLCCRADTDPALSHLWLKTAAQNSADMVAKRRGRAAPGEANGMATLTAEQVEEIRRSYRRSSYHDSNAALLARQYGVRQGTITRIIRAERWVA